MGLTIHYNLRANATSVKRAKELVAQLRQRALDLPFANVGELVELTGPACNFNNRGRDDPLGWLVVQAGEWIERPAAGGRRHIYSIRPTHVIGFSTWPGQGCEPANFGLCQYPATIEVQAEVGPSRRRMATASTRAVWLAVGLCDNTPAAQNAAARQTFFAAICWSFGCWTMPSRWEFCITLTTKGTFGRSATRNPWSRTTMRGLGPDASRRVRQTSGSTRLPGGSADR